MLPPEIKRLNQYCRLLTGIAAFLFLFSSSAAAWEFEMKGEYENRFRWFGRMGTTDLFGISTLQDAGAETWVGFAGPSLYNTGAWPANYADRASSGLFPLRITRGGFSTWGSDAFYNDSRLILYPAVNVNKAIKLHGAYNIGGVRHKYFQNIDSYASPASAGLLPLERYYMSQTSMNAYEGVMGTWEQFRATLTLPIGIWSVGLKDFPVGVGATLGYNTRAESFLMLVPYGPFTFMGLCWLARGRFLEGWDTVPDGDTKNTVFTGMLMNYEQGRAFIGAASFYRQYHQRAGMSTARARATGLATPASQPDFDETNLINMVYFKFNDGRVFANGEYAWLNTDRYSLGAAQRYTESQHAFVEAGGMAGPAKLSLAWAWAPGNPLNGGNPTKARTPWPINWQAMEPYEWLMFNTYGGGNWNAPLTPYFSFVDDEHGMMIDAWALAARVDYAVASNLNVWASYIWAHRVEAAGFLAGGYAGDENGSPVAAGAEFMAQYGGATPYVPDGFVGWETDLGVDWKLLEGLTMKFRYAWWQPGPWFDYAYQAIGIYGGDIVPSAIVQGRDPIHAFQGSIRVEF
jgi:hypothetical protein